MMRHPVPMEGERLARHVFAGNICLNILLSAGKLFTGLVAKSGALVSDGVDSAADVFSTVVVMVGMKISGRESDKKHPYGHERFECIAALVLALMLAVTGVSIGISGVKKLSGAEELAVPGLASLIVAAISLLIKTFMSIYTRMAANKLNSSALRADALNFQGDALAAVGILGGVFGARMGVKVLDPIAGLIICLFILKSAFAIARDAFNRMMDTACDTALEDKMRTLILAQSDVWGVDSLRTRLFGNRIYVEVEISTDGEMSLRTAHGVAQRVHDAIEREFPEVKHCMVHVNPAEEE